MLFTSGSTGIPKGVVVSQRAVIDYIEWQCATLPFDEFSVLGSQAPFYFDASMPDIYTPLRCGGKLVIIPEVLFLFPNKLIEYILKKKVNTLIWVPSALMTLTNKNFFDSNQIPKLKLVMFCGEVMPCKHLNKWIQYCPDAMYVNLYGPTETAYACTYYIVQRKFEDDEKLPIGYPCGNTDIIVMDDYNCKIDTKNTIGELCVRGSSLALGYYKDTVKTENCFVSNPLNSSYSEKIYKTGDLVQYNKWGELEFIGRKDYQIKKMGYRIELGEIETVTYSISAVKQVVQYIMRIVKKLYYSVHYRNKLIKKICLEY